MSNKSDNEISDEEILRLWHDPSFDGSFRGIKTFQKLLKTDLNYSISEKRLFDILKTDQLFLIHQRPKRNFDRRKYNVHSYGELVQLDLAFMFPDSETSEKYFLLAIDIFSFKIFAEPLKDKTSTPVIEALRRILKNFHHTVYKIQADRGREFVNRSFAKFLQENKIFASYKRGKNKASFAEYGILLVKRKLYLLLRSQMKHTWVTFLPKVVDSLNNTPLKRLGWLTPNSIHDEASSVFVDQAKSKNNISTEKLPTYSEQQENQQNYDGDLKKDDYVYLDFDENVFGKSFDVSVRKSSICSGWCTFPESS